jgi:hypothetical protein
MFKLVAKKILVRTPPILSSGKLRVAIFILLISRALGTPGNVSLGMSRGVGTKQPGL